MKVSPGKFSTLVIREVDIDKNLDPDKAEKRLRKFIRVSSLIDSKIFSMKIHHIAIICSDYEVSKSFYTEIVGLNIIREVYREERKSYKLDLAIGNHYVIELFSFPDPPPRPSRPEACGLRHLAFSVESVQEKRKELMQKGLICEDIRTDEFTGKAFFFTQDPDNLPLEFYEI